MPRYFFNLRNALDVDDEEGVDLPDADAARAHAIMNAREMAGEDVKHGFLNLDDRIEVVDAAGAAVLTLTFRESFELRRR